MEIAYHILGAEEDQEPWAGREEDKVLFHGTGYEYAQTYWKRSEHVETRVLSDGSEVTVKVLTYAMNSYTECSGWAS